MEKNYQELQVQYFPNNPTNCNGNPTVYEDLIWTEEQISKQQLDDVWLGFLKNHRYVEIDNRTAELINIGFTFDGHIFSMSLTAQINWSNFPNLPDQLFPLNVVDANESTYVLALANKLNFYFSALNYKNQFLQSGGVLKAEIKACTTAEEVNAIIDNR